MKKLILFVCFCLLSCNAVLAQLERGLKKTATVFEKTKERLALVIGNADYEYAGKLANPTNDADSMCQYLRNLGFDVLLYKNLTKKQLDKAIEEFEIKLTSYSIGLFFFAGHGAEASGENYLFPVDKNPSTESDAQYECYSLNQVLGKMESSQTNINIVIIDACRNNPFKARWARSSGQQGLANIESTKGTLISFAARPGSTAADGKGKNGVYTQCILKNINKVNVSVNDMFTMVNNDVRLATNDKQVPVTASSLNKVFYLNQDTSISSSTIVYVDNPAKNNAADKNNLVSRNNEENIFNLESINGSRFEETTSNNQLTFTLLQGNKLSFSGKIKNYPVNGKLKQTTATNFEVIEGNISGNISFMANGQRLSGTILLKEASLACSLTMKKKK